MIIKRLLDQLRDEERELTVEIGRLEAEGSGSSESEDGESPGQAGPSSSNGLTRQ